MKTLANLIFLNAVFYLFLTGYIPLVWFLSIMCLCCLEISTGKRVETLDKLLKIIEGKASLICASFVLMVSIGVVFQFACIMLIHIVVGFGLNLGATVLPIVFFNLLSTIITYRELSIVKYVKNNKTSL